MQTIAFMNALEIRKQPGATAVAADARETQNRKSRLNPTTSILLGAACGAISALLGFALFVVYAFSSGQNRLVNYGGVAAFILSFIFFGIVAHFMDELDARKRDEKRLRYERAAKENNSVE